MKRIIAIITALTMMQVAFSQTATVGKTDKQAALGATGAHFTRPNPGYMKGRGPVANQSKPATVTTPATSNTTATIGYTQPKVATVQATPQQAKMSNDQRVANLNARLAQNKAREQAIKANTAKPAQTTVPTTTLKRPTGLKNPAVVKANSNKGAINTKEVTR